MVTVSILYPNIAGRRFDFDYYTAKHMPRSVELLGAHPGFRSMTVERGLAGTEPGVPPKFVAACFYTFDSVDAFIEAFTSHAEELQADMSNYTDIPPDIQFNEILIETDASHG